MILYCDSSALVKLYIEEAGSNDVRAAANKAEAVTTCRISWAEIHAALARRAREVPADAPMIEEAKNALATDWLRYVVVELSQNVVERAGEYADTFAPRGYDSVQLAAAKVASETAGLQFSFACFDARLNNAARVLGLEIVAAGLGPRPPTD